ncbi:MAG: hypothetical protein A3J73_01785 [Planctomycetes bacterium RIFCSPHIGHO2_02_FULL_38_41]|nr:MAG: hypothetical protein A3J73_01785 [Planctomycetes bacterium RIFCSPHIGHO2_02_FULL_38_41]OHB91552.1 MAG: hypothetical protein A2Z57_06720 [Planctomycetes bacterium RIFCSPHIGHO2_12_39_6]OHB97368.1 MAG: hypothetical protein A2W74_06085 [Planctomycetes bacterium RIFCSPLOWO2_12_38_17]
MNSTYIKQGTMLNCSWNLKDALKVFIAYITLMFAGMPIIVRIIYTISGHKIQDLIGQRSIILFVTLFINLLVCSYVFYIVYIKYRQPVSTLGLTNLNISKNIILGIKRYSITIPIIMLAGFIINLISNYFGITPDMQDVVKWLLEEKSLFVIVSLIFFGTIVAPFLEEIIFRGFLQSALKNSFTGRYAIILSSAIFAGVHMDPFAFLQIFILGILLGYLFEKTQTLVASVVVHIMHNSLTLVFLLYFKYFLKGRIPVF